MFGNPSLVTRIAIGKAVGFAFGLVGFIFLPHFWPDASLLLRVGILFWYITLGAIIGVFGVMTYHPVLRLTMPWWIRDPLIGGWMSFVLTFFAYDAMQTMLIAMFGYDGVLNSPFWFVAEGAIIGLIIGYFATRFGGEGRDTLDEQLI
ncbi:MAG: hypothetical protein ACKE5M_08475 [Methylophilaceae bacterium]